MDSVPVAYKVAAVVIDLYGLVSLVGGIMGYLKAGSVASAAAGVPSGILLLIFGIFVLQRASWALIGAIVVALAVGGFFTSNLLKHTDNLGAFLQSSAGPRTLGMAVGGLVVIIVAAVALATSPRV
jgi:uncharacterized membrane protein (UPF0136 family)